MWSGLRAMKLARRLRADSGSVQETVIIQNFYIWQLCILFTVTHHTAFMEIGILAALFTQKKIYFFWHLVVFRVKLEAHYSVYGFPDGLLANSSVCTLSCMLTLPMVGFIQGTVTRGTIGTSRLTTQTNQDLASSYPAIWSTHGVSTLKTFPWTKTSAPSEGQGTERTRRVPELPHRTTAAQSGASHTLPASSKTWSQLSLSFSMSLSWCF